MSHSNARAFIASVLLIFGIGLVHASERDAPGGVITLPIAIDTALKNNPDLAVGGYELSAAQAWILQAKLRPNPEISLELEDFGGTGSVRGIQAMQSTLSLSQVVELGNKRMHRVDVAASDGELLFVERQARELDVLAEVTRRFIDVIAAQEEVTLARDATALADRTANTLVARVQAARSPQAELSRARIALTRARIEQQQAESLLNGTRHSLAALWGDTQVRFASAQANLYDLPRLESFEALRDRLESNPDLIRFASQARVRDAELRLAQANARPNLNLNLGIRRNEAANDTGLVAGFTVGLPVFDRNQGAIAEAHVRRRQSRAEEQAARIKTQAVLYSLYQQVSASRDQLATLRGDALPQAQAALSQIQTGHERGRFSYLELATAQQDLLGLRTAAVNAAAASHRLTAEIERLTGEPLAASIIEQELP
jgi:cobalt-zinc-cadmium efflux system outer membrane protein